jgi:hypothetical protein
MNKLLDSKTLNQLLAQREAPCLSLYQPTHRSFPERPTSTHAGPHAQVSSIVQGARSWS